VQNVGISNSTLSLTNGVVLAARYSPMWQVVAGTTLGMLLANAPVVLFGARFAHRLPLRAARWTAAAVFAALAVWVAWKGLAP
jgi:putative Ca2+/H+ antiporter (TMEM165/GDT1 family)